MNINNPAPVAVFGVVENDGFDNPLDAWIQSNGIDTQVEVDQADLITIFNPDCNPMLD